MLALNFPGRNGSGLPSSKQFGDLTIEDYTAVLLGVLDQLPKKIKVESILGHSMGGLIVQLAQNSLRSIGTSLQKEYGIKNVYLLSPSIPDPRPWSFLESGLGASLLSPFPPLGLLSSDPILGDYLQLLSPNEEEQTRRFGIWLAVFFAKNLDELVRTPFIPEFVPGTPFDALTLGYVSDEARIMTLQLFRSPPPGLGLASVNPGIFNKSVQKCFRIVSFSEDFLVPAEDLLNLDSYLSGDARSANVALVDAPDAVHDMYISNPTEVAKTITSCH